MAMTAVLTFPLPDGPLTSDHVMTARAALIHRMARELIAAGTYADYADSILTLVKASHSRFDIYACIDEARQVAVQHKVAMEMCQS